MNNNINIVYIDDNIDLNLSQYIDSKFDNYISIQFLPNDNTYESLLKHSAVQSANIILVDSRLFEDATALNGKFTGEEFKIILKKLYPFIEVIVLTQNIPQLPCGTICKFNSRTCDNADVKSYYDQVLLPILTSKIDDIKIFQNLYKNIQQNSGIEKYLLEKIENSINGDTTYDNLTTKDLDSIIEKFQELQRHLDI